MTTTEPGQVSTTGDSPPPDPHRRDGSAYRLRHTPDGTSWTAREDLVDILDRELLGPANGHHEILDTTPDSAYLIGRIAPYKLTAGRDAPRDATTGDPDTDVGDEHDANQVQGVPVTPVDETTAGSDEDSVEDQPQKRGLVIPSSMGLRCQIPADLKQFTVTASWAIYTPFKEDLDGAGPSHPRFQRTPFEFPTPVTVADLDPNTTTEYSLRDAVVLRIDRYDDDALGRRVIEIALCNNRETPRKIPTDAWLYQTALTVTADGDEVFLPVHDPLTEDRFALGEEDNRLYLQYRNRLEFAIGRTCSVDWDVAEGARRATAVRTTWLPVTETPHTVPGEVEALLDMCKLAEASPDELRAGLEPVVTKYAQWLDDELARAEGRADEPALPPHLLDEAREAVAEARRVHEQLAAGLDHLLADEQALRCFRFMNEVMAEQRIHSQVAQLRAEKRDLDIDEARTEILGRGPRAHSWRTFQLAFVLMQLPMLTDPTAARRSSDLAKAQLLFFPTGGGKTEAYLGLAAYTFAIRRLQGIQNTPEGPLDGNTGVAVLMRYTLRLLTAQQFQRATALMCAAEMVRRADLGTWGAEPFRIGLWVGTDVSPKRVNEAEEQLKKASEGRGHRMTVLQIQRCPWCGHTIDGQRDVAVDMGTRRVRVFCGDDLAECPFSRGGAADEGLPVLTVDEEIYRLTPAFVIATVDKFARLAREGEAAALFGYVSARCDRHGYVHPDYDQCKVTVGEKHPEKKEQQLPAAAVRTTGRLRPPDLIIQDELHLITGALGTTVGLFESAIDTLCTWRTADGQQVQPLVVASTATARNSAEQVQRLYGRGVTIFPPQVLDVGHTFFSREIRVRTEHDDPASTATQPGRRYVGISTTGVRITTAQIRISEILMAAGQLLLNRFGAVADPYMTLVGYFSATRELAGMVRYLGDDVQTLLSKGRPWSLLPRRDGTIGTLNTEELTSRKSGSDITAILDRMAAPFDPVFDATGAKRGDQRRPVAPYDAVLATSMLQVGVDVTRLGLMLVVGQPKNTAEYIQASSRVGRDTERPGLVVSLGNWARPRDLAHFEQFRHYHETFYAQVEPLSVTPYSVTALDRGLDGVLVSAARVLQAGSRDGLSPETHAGRVTDHREFIDGLLDRLTARMLRAAADEDATEHAKQRLRNRVDHWFARRAHADNRGHQLAYAKDPNGFEPLIMNAEDADQLRGSRAAAPFEIPNSMREVQPEINLLVSPDPAKLRYDIPLSAPEWRLPEAKDDKA
ncbi:DISARM system helicase DrmA [Nocardia asteroides]|uniref:DISARM system helicase DrmA n=1 Tax=Nocardia asteroides TaxID=1824 RepID=UPI0037B3602E